LPSVFRFCKSLLYADDLVLYAHAKSVSEVQQILQDELRKLSKWCEENDMQINVTKTKSMIFMNRKTKLDPLVLSVNGCSIESVTTFKYLGVVLDQFLNFKVHFDTVCKKIRSRINLIRRYKKHYTRKQVLVFVNSLVFSINDYCLPVWGYVCKSEIGKIDKLLLKALTLVPTRMKLGSVHDVFENCNQLTFSERRDLYATKFIFNQGVLESETSSLFAEELQLKQLERSSLFANNFVVPSLRTVFGQRSWFYQGIKFWNSMPPHIKELITMGKFEKEARSYLLKLRGRNYSN